MGGIKNILKRIFTTILLLVVILNITGIFIVFKIEQAQIRKSIKHEIKQGIPEDELHFFSLSQEEYEQLDWERPDIEFRIGREMFDIVRSEKSDDSIHLYCVNDKEEAILFARLDEMIQKRMNQEPNSPNNPIVKIIKMSKLLYLENEFYGQKYSDASQNPNLFPEYICFYSSPFLTLPTPPPDTV